MKTPENPAEITLHWLQEQLHWNSADCRPIAFDIDPEFGNTGLLGKIARLQFVYPQKGCGPPTMVAKFQACSDKEREGTVYRLLSKAKVKNVPAMYGIFDNGLLFMQDLSFLNYRSQLSGSSPVEAEDLLSTLAGIHAHFLRNPGIPADNPEKFAAVIDYNMEQCWQLFEERYSDSLSNAGSQFEWMWSNSKKVAAQHMAEPTTLAHGDVHAENILFPENDGESPFLIDWQLASKKTLPFDASFFLTKSLTVEERRKNESSLLKNYFSKIPGAYQSHYSFDDFYLGYRACVTRSMLSAVMLVGPRFSFRADQFELADLVAERVIAAVHDLDPVDAVRELAESR